MKDNQLGARGKTALLKKHNETKKKREEILLHLSQLISGAKNERKTS